MKEKIILPILILLAFSLRIYGINWDQGQHLHPDERFLTMVGMAMKLPASMLDYLNPAISTFNPYNIGYDFFVYGTFPLTLTKILAIAFNLDNYNDFTLLGRFLSATFDIMTMFFVYKIMQVFELRQQFDARIKYLAAFFYAISVLPIQHAHFFVVESFLNCIVMASFYYSLRSFYTQKSGYVIVSAIFFGLALGTKVSAVYVLPLLLFFVFYTLIKNKRWKRFFYLIIFFGVISYLTLRIADPRFFENGNIFNPTISSSFSSGLSQLKTFTNPQTAQYFPPSIQWYNKPPIVYALTNIAFFGLGIPLFVLTIIGLILFMKERRVEYIALGIWTIIFFLYQSTRFSPSMRYFIFLYPFFAIYSGLAFNKLVFHSKQHHAKAIGIAILFIVLIWPASFVSIYSRPHSRVTASAWIHQNIPENAYIIQEHWDDALPLQVSSVINRVYRGEQIPVFGQDSPEKWQAINASLEKADYYITTSGRAYQHIMNLPDMYPQSSRFYQDLFADKTQFKKIKEFTSYPTLPFVCRFSALGCRFFQFEDQWAEEAFTVYDHPKVTVFKKYANN